MKKSLSKAVALAATLGTIASQQGALFPAESKDFRAHDYGCTRRKSKGDKHRNRQYRK